MFKDFSIFSSGGHLVYRSGRILAILVGNHLGNIPMKFESHWPKGLSIGFLTLPGTRGTKRQRPRVQEELAFKANYS